MNKINFDLILRIISILSLGTSFFSFIVTELVTNTKSPNFIEYTDLSRFFLNLYILLIYLLCLVHSVYPSILCPIITESLSIITTIKGKIILSLAIDIMYYSTESLPQKLFGMITFICVLALFLGDIVFNCEILKQQPMQENNDNAINNPINETQNSLTINNLEGKL